MQDAKLATEMQELFASPYMRINHTSDVIGVEICGALKNVLAIAAGIVEGLELGHNAMAALVTQVPPPSLQTQVRSLASLLSVETKNCSEETKQSLVRADNAKA